MTPPSRDDRIAQIRILLYYKSCYATIHDQAESTKKATLLLKIMIYDQSKTTIYQNKELARRYNT